MARVIDYAWGRPTIATLKAAGAVAVCRYLSWLPNGKCLSKAEADFLRAGGIDVVSNWEYFGDWTHDYSGGFAFGAIHAVEANKQHLACGGPPGRPIYFSTDWDVTPAQKATIADYYRGVASVIGLNRTGAYGGYWIIKYLFDAGAISWGWQSFAWSGGQWDPRAQLRQVQNGVTIGGVDCDLDDSMVADFGQWGAEEVMATASDYIVAWANGMSLTPDKKVVSPVDWRIRDEAWQLRMTNTLTQMQTSMDTRSAGYDAAITTIVGMLTVGGGDMDVSVIINAINASAETASASVAALTEEVHALRTHNADLQSRLNAALDDPVVT